jgi:truncated hemoglobin YjbI
MKHSGLTLASLAFSVLAGCSPGQLDSTPISTPTPTPPVVGPSPAPTPSPAPGGDSLYQRLGGQAGISKVVGDFLGRTLADPRINGYFLNAKVDGNNVGVCLVLQIGSLTGGPEKYPSMGCRDMKTIHKGMKVSMQDFKDLAEHLVAALTAAKVPQADINTIVAAVGTTVPDIVEDPNSNGTVYQRVGRKPAIATVIKNFATRVLANTRINGFFTGTDANRLLTCLVRQVCSIDGPCKYGEEVDGEPGVGKANPCKDMVTVHKGMTSPPGGGGNAKLLTIADFNALVTDLVTELKAANVAAADQMAILGALGPLCTQIVANGTGCM